MLFTIMLSLYIPWDTTNFTVPNGIYANGETPRENDLVCAHRTLKFGTRVTFTNGQRSVTAVIKDRGPYGVVGGKQNKQLGYRQIRRDYYIDTTTLYGPHYRADFDCTPAVHRALGTSGLTRVGVFVDGKNAACRIRPTKYPRVGRPCVMPNIGNKNDHRRIARFTR